MKPKGDIKTDLSAFFSQTRAAYQKAEQSIGGSINRRFRIGGHLLELRFAGPALACRITPALEHLAVSAEGEKPGLKVFLWDNATTGTRMPSPPWSGQDYRGRSEVHGFGDARFRLAFHLGSGILNLMDTRARIALYWIRDAGLVPYYECGAPMLPLLNWWLNAHGLQVVHAAAVGTPSGGVLLTGKGGSGKSTTALSCCFLGGLLYAGDDYCLVDYRIPHVYSLFNSAKLDRQRLRDSFPHLDPVITNAGRLDREKPLIFLQQTWPRLICPHFPIRAIMMTRINGSPKTNLIPAKSRDLFKTLGFSTIFQLAAAGEDELRLIAGLVRRTPAYFLELGSDLASIAPVIRHFLQAN